MVVAAALVMLTGAGARGDMVAASTVDDIESGSFPILGGGEEITLHFHNFRPQGEAAERGLRYVYKNNVLALKGGVSVRALNNVSMIPLLDSYGQADKLGVPSHQWRHYGYLPSPPSRRVGTLPEHTHFPLHLNIYRLGDSGYVPEEDSTILTVSCLTCHAGVIAGQVIAGVNNNYADFRPFLADNESLQTLRSVIRFNPLWEVSSIARFGMTQMELTFLDLELDYFDKVLTPMLEEQVTRGVIPGPASVLTYLTRLSTNAEAASISESLRDDTGAIIEEDLRQLPHPVPPADPNPWWSIKYKSTLYLYPEEQGESLAQTAENFMHRHIGVSDRIAPRHHKIVEDVLRYVIQTAAPAYPWPLDPEQVERGRQLFHEKPTASRGARTCSFCHGSYTWNNGRLAVDYSEHYAEVGTDRAVFDVGRYIMDKTLQRIDPEEVASYGSYPRKPGYPSQPLVGVWASAPYLHNGSVPTLYGVLRPSARPNMWARPFDPRAYDRLEGGIAVVEPEDAHDPSFVYDTRRPGYGNNGHDFVEDWDEDSVNAVVEFLKSLSE